MKRELYVIRGSQGQGGGEVFRSSNKDELKRVMKESLGTMSLEILKDGKPVSFITACQQFGLNYKAASGLLEHRMRLNRLVNEKTQLEYKINRLAEDIAALEERV